MVSTEILSSTNAFNIDNNKKCFLSILHAGAVAADILALPLFLTVIIF